MHEAQTAKHDSKCGDASCHGFLEQGGIENVYMWAQKKPAEKRWIKQKQDTGICLSLISTRLNGNNLAAEEFRDNLLLCYNYAPLDMSQCCDGCGAKMAVNYALLCKVEGMMHMQHDNIANKCRHLCKTTLLYGKVER